MKFPTTATECDECAGDLLETFGMLWQLCMCVAVLPVLLVVFCLIAALPFVLGYYIWAFFFSVVRPWVLP